MDPHHDGHSFDPSSTSDEDPSASVAASHPWDAACVAARSDSAEEASAGGVGAYCQSSNFAGTSPEPSFVPPIAVVGRPPPGIDRMRQRNSVWSDLFGDVDIGTLFGGG